MPIPQRVITVSLRQSVPAPLAFYSYLSPITGLSYIDAPTCDISCSQPTYTLFILDFASSMNGWTIIDTTPKLPSLRLDQAPGPNGLSVQVDNPHIDDTTKYNFYINYINSVTGQTVSIDPQENNVPRLNSEPDDR